MKELQTRVDKLCQQLEKEEQDYQAEGLQVVSAVYILVPVS